MNNPRLRTRRAGGMPFNPIKSLDNLQLHEVSQEDVAAATSYVRRQPDADVLLEMLGI